MSGTKRANLKLLLFCAPALVVYLVFKLYPAVAGIGYAMTDWNGLSKDYEFVLFDNFIAAFKDKYFWQSIWFTLSLIHISEPTRP